jgi:hypothetical protein
MRTSNVDNDPFDVQFDVARAALISEDPHVFHVDAATAIIYLNEVLPGETEIFPNFRLLFRDGRHQRIQRRLDDVIRPRLVRRLFGHQNLVVPRRGTLGIMRGNTTLHSVREILGSEDRIAVVLSWLYPDRATRETRSTIISKRVRSRPRATRTTARDCSPRREIPRPNTHFDKHRTSRWSVVTFERKVSIAWYSLT